MANGRVERISAEHNTGVRIADDSPLLSWLPRFTAQVMNKMRIGKDGKTSEIRRTGRRWRKPSAQFGEEVWFRQIGDDGSSFASRMTQGIFVGHHDSTGAGLCITKNGVVRGKIWTIQTLEWCCGIDELGRFAWHSVANGGSRIEVDEESYS